MILGHNRVNKRPPTAQELNLKIAYFKAGPNR